MVTIPYTCTLPYGSTLILLLGSHSLEVILLVIGARLCVGISGWRRVTITLPVGKRIILLDLWNEFSCSSQILGISIDDPCLILRLYLFIWASTLWATLLMIAHWKARTCFLTPTPILQAIAPLPYYFEKLTSPYPLAISHCYLKGLLLLCGNSSFTALFFYNMDPELLSVMENLQFIEEKSTVVVTETNIVDKDTASTEAKDMILKREPWVVHDNLFSIEPFNPIWCADEYDFNCMEIRIRKVTPALNDAAIVFVIEPTTVTATVEATNCTQQSTLAANEGTQDNMVSVLTVIFGVYAAEGSS
ncbi:hypothetical protein V6N12_009683 [Hibiscus sabdariffa]|uniref:Uncharacterized protein n=1 Tax=Hibiscus sabdariffa TaxID=183260 RepID=A0ABR2BUM0_9ROSI